VATPRPPNVAFPANQVGPANLCDACYHFYVPEDDDGREFEWAPFGLTPR
jgi:hypothetical protein